MTESETRIIVPQTGVLGPVAIPTAIGAVGVAAGLTTNNPVALAVGGLVVAAGLVFGGAYAVGRVLNDWPRTVASASIARRTLAENRPARADVRRALGWTVVGNLLFLSGLVPLWVVAGAARAGSFGVGLPDALTWILAVFLLGGSVLVSFVGGRTVGRGVDRMVVAAASEWAYRRRVDGTASR